MPKWGFANHGPGVENGSMGCRYLDHLRNRRSRPAVSAGGWAASLLLHLAAAAAAWAVTAPMRFEPSELIGQTSRVELAASISQAEVLRPAPAPEVEAAWPVRIMPAEAEIARRHFRVESTSVAEPTPFEQELVERIMARPISGRPAREFDEPAVAAQPWSPIARQAAAPPLPSQPGTADRPLPELIQSPPPVYPQNAIERRWEGTVLLRLGVTAEGRVGEVEVVESSGHAVLDGEAARAVRAWRFVPAVRDGRPVASFVRLPVRFDLSTGGARGP